MTLEPILDPWGARVRLGRGEPWPARVDDQVWADLRLDAEAHTPYALASRLHEDRHPQSLRQIRWVDTMLKTRSPQILASL